ncbi:hypothetical protein U9M48_020878 [Paspalum notatum var. saurae]|uniref:Uncharacterized protein n=1 Tax=Paspalum notatum var. saurae TaxID=547442 RepID=A0AAQ3THW7_PASNO
MDPTRFKPDSFKKFKDVSSPIEDGISPENPGASRPSIFKDLTLPMELGIIPEKLVSPTSNFCYQRFQDYCEDRLSLFFYVERFQKKPILGDSECRAESVPQIGPESLQNGNLRTRRFGVYMDRTSHHSADWDRSTVSRWSSLRVRSGEVEGNQIHELAYVVRNLTGKVGELSQSLKPRGRELGHIEIVLAKVEIPEGGSSPALSKPQFPKSSEVTQPSASPQRTPAQPQKSVPVFHDRNAMVETVNYTRPNGPCQTGGTRHGTIK